MTRSHAHRDRPSGDDLGPRDVVGFLVGLAVIVLLLVLVFATGPRPA